MFWKHSVDKEKTPLLNVSSIKRHRQLSYDSFIAQAFHSQISGHIIFSS